MDKLTNKTTLMTAGAATAAAVVAMSVTSKYGTLAQGGAAFAAVLLTVAFGVPQLAKI